MILDVAVKQNMEAKVKVLAMKTSRPSFFNSSFIKKRIYLYSNKYGRCKMHRANISPTWGTGRTAAYTYSEKDSIVDGDGGEEEEEYCEE